MITVIFLSVVTGAAWAILAGIVTHFFDPTMTNFVMFTIFLSFSAIAFIGLTIGSVRNIEE